MPAWLPTTLALVALVVAGFALLRANRVDSANRRAIAALRHGRHDEAATLSPAHGDGAVPDQQRSSLLPVDPAALRRVAVVRYDAFPDVGGRQSFSVALLNESADGIVLSAIHSRTETRSYVKRITAATGETALSPEEIAAVTQATTSPR